MKSNAARPWRRLPTRERLRCIVVESGSDCFAQRNAEGFDETIAIAQMAGEQPAVFAERTLARIAGVERSGRHFDSILVLTGDARDVASHAARRGVVLGLSAHARAHGQPTELLLQAQAEANVRQRTELLELVGEVTESAGAISVRLCFGESSPSAPPRSGVFAKPVPGRG
jgi:hypothetical protein